MSFKKIAVLCDVYEMSKGKQIKVGDKVGDPIFIDRIFGLLDTNKRNADYKNKRRWIDIKWEETAVLQLEAGNTDWIEYALEEKELECKGLKRAIKFPVKDSYTEALDDGEELEKYDDYILAVEAQIEVIKSIEFKPKEDINNSEEEYKKELRAKIKALGGKSQGIKTVDKLLEKIDELTPENNPETEED